MKKILIILICFSFVLSCSFTNVSAYSTVNNIVAFGDSIMAGYSAKCSKLSQINWNDYYGNTKFSYLLAKEYGIEETGFDNVAKAGAFIGNSEYWKENKSSSSQAIYEDQILKYDTTKLKNADVVLMDGGINDCSFAVGFEIYDCSYTTAKLSNETKSVSKMTLDEAKTFLEKYKAMSEEEVADYITNYSKKSYLHSWDYFANQVYYYFDNSIDYINSTGFDGKIYIQNVVNPFKDGNVACCYLWDNLINYCITDQIEKLVSKYTNVELIDLCSEIQNSSEVSGIKDYDYLHLSYKGNEVVYEKYSKAINPDSTPLQFEDNTVPTTATWKSIYDFEGYDENQIPTGISQGEVKNSSELSTVLATSGDKILFDSDKITLVLPKDLGKVYGIKCDVYTASARSYFEINGTARNGLRQLSYYTGTAWTSVCLQTGTHAYEGNIQTQVNCSDFSLGESISLYRNSADSSKGLYIDNVQLLTDDTLILGDVNNDKVIDPKDTLALKKYLAGFKVSAYIETADLNKDGKIGLRDLLLLRKLLV